MDDAFELYPCLVDDAPASIYVNLRFEHDTPAFDTRYTVAIAMREHGEHGIGTADEGDAVNRIEEALIEDGALTYVGRIRTRGIWETVLYGPPGHADALHTRATAHAGGRRIDVRAVRDTGWTYYRELLLPDAERRQWIEDRRMVQILTEQGDRNTTPRRVDHRLAFPTDLARAAFLAAVAPLGFVGGEHSVHRVDPIDLDHIHDVVMSLIDAAAPHGGTYDRWETAITS